MRAAFNGVKVFSANLAEDRTRLGERVTDWISRSPEVEIRGGAVTQSSDCAFHCLTITVFYTNRAFSAGSDGSPKGGV